MSETLLKFFLKEMSIVRIVCAKCQTAFEMSIVQLMGIRTLNCPCCEAKDKDVNDSRDNERRLSEFAHAVNDLQKLDKFKVEFVFKSPESK